jgi:hypothetical protein
MTTRVHQHIDEMARNCGRPVDVHELLVTRISPWWRQRLSELRPGYRRGRPA